ncbi:MAG: SxtJ family membrane protein [Candidatus Omnitrophota bacterium]
MIWKEIKNIDSSRKKLKEFGLLVGGISGLLGLFLLWKGRMAYPYFLIPASLLLAGGIFCPAILRPLHKAWMTLALILGWIVSHILLTLLFYLGVAPIGLLTRLAGKDLLSLKIEKGRSSYWIPRDPAQNQRERCERQF